MLKLAVCLLALLTPISATAAELVMLHQPGCAWCLRFEAEIGKAYPKTDQARACPTPPG